MKIYIQWFVEEVIQKQFCTQETIELWIIQKKEYTNRSIENIKMPQHYEVQMTIFDMVS